MPLDTYYRLLSIALGNDSGVTLTDVDDTCWQKIYHIAGKQGMLGVTYSALELLPQNKRPQNINLVLNWYANAEQIALRNQLMDKTCNRITDFLRKRNINGVVLKGQSIAKLYPQPKYRSAGDIDIWVRPCDWTKESITKMILEIRKRISNGYNARLGHVHYYHMDWKVSHNINIEVHYRPQYFNNPLINYRFQHWAFNIFKTFNFNQGDTFCTPTVEFNIVYQLEHMYHHLLFEGLGMRQVVDYAVLLRSIAEDENIDKTIIDHAKLTIDNLGMTRFAQGMMWVLHRVCGIPKNLMLWESDPKMGNFILGEMERYTKEASEIQSEGGLLLMWHRTIYRARFIAMFPSEILFDLPFRIGHWCWRKWYQHKYGWK